MNIKSLYPLAVLLAALSFSGCKTMDDSALAPPGVKPVSPGTQYAPRIEENAAYIAHVESMARRRGVSVRWVHKPVKRHVDRE